MLPAVRKVILIDKALAGTQPERAEPHLVRIGAAAVPILAALDDETMQMLVAPVKATCRLRCTSGMVPSLRTSRRRQINGLTPRRTARSW
jgi:hypothetical protein